MVILIASVTTGWTSQEAWRGRPAKITIQITVQILHNYKLTVKLKAIPELGKMYTLLTTLDHNVTSHWYGQFAMQRIFNVVSGKLFDSFVLLIVS